MKFSYFNEEHEDIREMAKQFAEKSVAPVAAQIDKTEEFPEELQQAMADIGFLGIKIPEEYGGIGLDMLSYACVMEEVAKKSAAATIFISTANSLGSAPLMKFGSEEQKKKFLPGVASGEIMMCFALTEPDAGSDAAAIRTKAEKDGENYILNGRKCFITGAPIADYAIVFAKTDPDLGTKGMSAFIVDMKTSGVSVGKPEEKMGQRGVPVSDLILDDVKVPADCLLGKEGDGFKVAMKTLDVGRIGVSSMALGMAREALEITTEHIKNRIQFGNPLAQQPVLRFRIADMETKLTAARHLVYDAAKRADENDPDAKLVASMSKYYSCETAKQIIDQCLQLFGGYGYCREYEIERLYRDIRINTIYEGSSEVQQIVIAGTLLH